MKSTTYTVFAALWLGAAVYSAFFGDGANVLPCILAGLIMNLHADVKKLDD